MELATTPELPTSKVYSDYIVYARRNLIACRDLATSLGDADIAAAMQRMIDEFHESAIDPLALIDEANRAPECVERVSFGMQHPDSPSFGRGW